jgi:hypothetical protein
LNTLLNSVEKERQGSSLKFPESASVLPSLSGSFDSPLVPFGKLRVLRAALRMTGF